MKLPIKKLYFDQIKNGVKRIELRDAHITFTCEETGESMTFAVGRTITRDRKTLEQEGYITEQMKELFDDDRIIIFELVRRIK